MERMQARKTYFLTLTLLLSSLLGLMMTTETKRVKAAMTRTIASAAVCVTDPVVTNNADNGAGSLRQAIADACDGSTITFADTVVSPITLSNELLIEAKSLTIQGPGTRQMVISGNNATPVFETSNQGLPIQVTFSDLTIANGRAAHSPAAGFFANGSQGTINIINCTISGNNHVSTGTSNGRGGGIFNNGTMNLTNCTITGNSATGLSNGSGGIYNSGTLNLTNCTITGNSTNTQGGGIFNNGGTINIKNTIIAGNTASQSGPDVRNTFNSLGYNLIGKSDNSTGFTNGVNNDQVGSIAAPLDPMLELDAMLKPLLKDNGGPTFTIALLAGSPAFDKGKNFDALTTDQRGAGFARTIDDPAIADAMDGDATDIGAFEFQQAPSFTACQQSITTANEQGQCSATVTFNVTATGSPQPTVVCEANSMPITSSHTFPVGATMVTCTATNGSGISAMCGFSVTVNDTQVPLISCPGNMLKSADPNLCTAVVTFTPTVSDNCSGVSTATCTPSSGSTFPKGTTTVNCSATDTEGNTSTCSFTVTVNDTAAPAITCLANRTVVTARSGDATVLVNYPAPTTSDNCGAAEVVCTPPSGSSFPVGTTTVTCTATDAAGNQSNCSFAVTTFDVCLQDDSSSSRVLLWNSQTGDYLLCCSGSVLSGKGSVSRKGNTFYLTHNVSGRRLSASVDAGASRGTASLQMPIGTTACSITDRDTRNNTCSCYGGS